MGVKGDEFPLQGQGTESLVGYGATPHVMTIIIKNALSNILAKADSGAEFFNSLSVTMKNKVVSGAVNITIRQSGNYDSRQNIFAFKRSGG